MLMDGSEKLTDPGLLPALAPPPDAGHGEVGAAGDAFAPRVHGCGAGVLRAAEARRGERDDGQRARRDRGRLERRRADASEPLGEPGSIRPSPPRRCRP